MCGAVGQSTLMANYDMDTFRRRFVLDSSFLSRFHVPQERLEAVREGDTALLLPGFDWISYIHYLTGNSPSYFAPGYSQQ